MSVVLHEQLFFLPPILPLFPPCLRTGVMWACFQHLGTRPYSPLWRNLNLAGYSRCFSMSWLIPQDCRRFSMSWLKPSDCWCFGIFIAEHLQPVSLYPPCLSGVSGRPSCFQRCGLNQSPFSANCMDQQWFCRKPLSFWENQAPKCKDNIGKR